MSPLAPELDLLLLPDSVQAESRIELVSIPVAVVTRTGDRLSILAANSAYRRAGLGKAGERSALVTILDDRIAAFLNSDEVKLDFAWTVGAAIDCCHYKVSFARLSSAIRHRCLISLVDVTSQTHTERSLRREMTTDSLTGLPNREGFGDVIEAAVASGTRHAVLVVDIDRFGRLNACLGSLAGDELLITVARRIKGALRVRDTLARIGGDEFAILMGVDDDANEAERLAERIRRGLQAPFRLTDYEIGVECSIGIARGGESAKDAEELIRHAQFAVKRAKASGRTEAYHRQAFTVARARFGMETALRCAIENRDLRLAYQPIVDLATGDIVAFEALARWADKNGCEHSPCDFIPAAEESGLIVPLGRWAIEQALRTLAQWDARAGGNCGVRLAVNLSAIQLQRDEIAPVIGDALVASGLSGDRLTLELTESAIVTDPDRIAATMRALRDLGATLAMDDFGTGYSNLALLQQLPIDILKIDRSFVTRMLADRDKLAIVRAVLSLAQALGMKTTAEGIETIELAQTLAALGCSYGQGFVYAQPLEADAAFALIAPPDNV